MSSLKLVAFVCVVALLVPSLCEAQIQHPSWAAEASFAPVWKVPSYQNPLFNATGVDLRGAEFTVGIDRGDFRKGYWGLSFVRRSVVDGGSVAHRENRGTTLAGSDVRLEGLEVYKFAQAASIRDRVQIGVLFGGGFMVIRGTAEQVPAPPNNPTGAVSAHSLYLIQGHALSAIPNVILEIEGTYVFSPHLKTRVAGGVNFPGQERISFGLLYYFSGF